MTVLGDGTGVKQKGSQALWLEQSGQKFLSTDYTQRDVVLRVHQVDPKNYVFLFVLFSHDECP